MTIKKISRSIAAVAVILISSLFCLSAVEINFSFENEVISLINQTRQTHGLDTVIKNTRLSGAARQHSRTMAASGVVDHQSPEGLWPTDRITLSGYDWRKIGENVAGGYATPQHMMDALLESPDHRRVLLDPEFCDIGVGYIHDDDSIYRHYWTQNFGRPKGDCDCPEVTLTTAPIIAEPAEEKSDLEQISQMGCFIATLMPMGR